MTFLLNSSILSAAKSKFYESWITIEGNTFLIARGKRPEKRKEGDGREAVSIVVGMETTKFP